MFVPLERLINLDEGYWNVFQVTGSESMCSLMFEPG